jgi:hypothetical protein
MRNFTFVTKSMLPFAKLTFGIGKPWKARVLGTELAGEVESAGKDACLPEKGALALKSHSLSWEEALAIPFGANTALYFLRDLEKVQADRSFGEHRLGWSAAGQTLWSDRDRGVQQRQRRNGEIPWYGQGDRLHEGRLHVGFSERWQRSKVVARRRQISGRRFVHSR